MTPSKSPPKLEATAHNLLRQSRELFAAAVEKDDDLFPDLEKLSLVKDSRRYLEMWERLNPNLSPRMVAEFWAQEETDPLLLDQLVQAVQKVLPEMASPQ